MPRSQSVEPQLADRIPGFALMIGLDTNILVRYVMQDDAKQSAKASSLIESLTPETPGFVPLAALVELVSVLISCYDLSRDQIAEALEALLRAKEIALDRAEQVAQALRVFRGQLCGFRGLSHRADRRGCRLSEDDDVRRGCSEGCRNDSPRLKDALEPREEAEPPRATGYFPRNASTGRCRADRQLTSCGQPTPNDGASTRGVTSKT